MGRVSHNALWNLAGNGLPLLVGLATIPPLLHGLGVERFGLLTLIWATLGYFSLFDLGLGRATTRFVAQNWASGDIAAASRILQVSLLVLLAVGLLLAGTLWSTAELLLSLLTLSDELDSNEVLRSLWVVFASIPVILLTAGARGALEGLGQFRRANLIKLPANMLIFLLPLSVLPFSVRLDIITLVLAVSRLIFMLVYLVSVRGLLSAANFPARDVARKLVKNLLSYGGWVFLALGLGTLMSMGYLDRMFIGSLLTVTDISYYAVPMEIVLRLLIIPGALVAAIFPVLSACEVNGEDVRELSFQALRVINLLLLPFLLLVLVIGEETLGWWIGEAFASHSYPSLQLLVVGLLFNALAHVPYTMLQASGRPAVTAIRHVAELPFYLLLLWGMLEWLGVTGAALTWMLWALADMWLLFWLVWRAGISISLQGRDLGLIVGVMSVGYFLGMIPSLGVKILGLVLIGLAYVVTSWRWYITEEQRTRLLRIVWPRSAI